MPGSLSHPPQRAGAPRRVLFTGQRTYVEPHLPAAPTPAIAPSFVDHRDGADFGPVLTAIEEQQPDAVVVFRPDTVPPGALAGVGCPVLGVATEPLPADGDAGYDMLDYNLAALLRTDRANIDRLVLCDPHGWERVSGRLPVWRCQPLPVDDGLYLAPRPPLGPPQTVFLGAPSPYREQTLIDVKHRFDLPHYAHGLLGEELRTVLHEADVAICLREHEQATRFPPTLLLHLAAGQLVLADRIEPGFGLEPDIHYLQVADRRGLDLRMHQLRDDPGAYDRVRIRGHLFARRFRASLVWSRLLDDLLDDLSVFGSHRPAVAA